MSNQMSKNRNFVADGVFFADLNEVLRRELAEDGYSGVEVRVTPMRTEIIIRATRTQIRFKFPKNSVELYAEKVSNRSLCAIAQAVSQIQTFLLGMLCLIMNHISSLYIANGISVLRACYGVLGLVMESGAKGCKVIVSGKLRAARAKSMKFKDGYMISSSHYIDSAVRHVLHRQCQGQMRKFYMVFLVSRSRIKIMLDWDPKGKNGPVTPFPDVVPIHQPKDEEDYVSRPSMMAPTEIEMAPQMGVPQQTIVA
ncbi:hypothetical protein C5167_017808 [Papaver somniferum]|uniref:Small ribosomal subunit protein uS3 C-terminal domain-containing protein n=1 Tax=Papaver somniferum TaxID=3469 RepID=A0A4Y7INT5_PAPSO|nr:hypothetical protein C5167_017808 [Papaver somniferum]